MTTPAHQFVLEHPLSSGLRRSLWLRQARRDHAATLGLARKVEMNTLRIYEDPVSLLRKSATTFVLGSGASICNLTNQAFHKIRQNNSVGINAWALHDFVPDIYMFETHANGGPPGADTRFISSHLDSKDYRAHQPAFLLLRPNTPSNFENLVKPPVALNSATHVYGRANFVATRLANLAGDIDRLLSFFHAGRLPLSILPDNGASAVRAVFLALFGGSRNIVLTGIDLNENPYFWQIDEKFSRNALLQRTFSRPTGVSHSTLSTANRPFSTLDFIVTLSQVLQNRYGVAVFAADNSSELSKFLPLYDWSLREH